MLRAVFFDAAGTLFDTRQPVGSVYAELARRFGIDADDCEVSSAFRRAFHAAPGLAFGAGYTAAELRRLEREWWRRLVGQTFAGLGQFTDFDGYFDTLFAFFADASNWQADSEARQLLQRLKQRGLVLGIISNFDFRLYGVLKGLGLARYFDSITISSEAGYAKPSSEVFEAALAKHSLRADQALHVGDSLALDVNGAAAVGMGALLVERDGSQSGELPRRAERITTLASVLATVERFS